MASEIASLFVKIGVDYKDFEAGLTQVGAMLSSVGDAMAKAGQQLTMGITLPLVAIGTAATKSAVELDRSMRNIQSISKESDASLGALKDTFKDMSEDITKTTASANELAEGFYQIQSSGFAGADAMQVLEASAKAGSAGLSTTATAATALTAALNAYGEGANKAADYSDIMFKAVDIGVMSFGELSSSLSNVITTAAATGVEFETVAAAMSTMTKQGMSASEASVSLNQVLTSLLKPSEALSEALADIGFESGQAALDALGLQGVLQALTDAGYDSSTEMADLFNNVRALRGVLSLTGDGAKMFALDLDAMANASGSTAEAFAIQMQSIEAQMDNLKNTAQNLGDDLFATATPAFQEIVNSAKALLDQFRELDPAMQKNIVKWGAIAAAAGPALFVFGRITSVFGSFVAISGSMSTALSSLYTSLTAASLAAGGFGGAMASLPLGLVAGTAAIGGMAAAIGAYNRQTADMARQADEYAKKQAELKAEATGMIDVVDQEANALGYLGDQTGVAVDGLGGFADAQMQAWRAAKETTDQIAEQAEATEEAAKVAVDYSQIMANASASMEAAGMSADQVDSAMTDLAATLGVAVSEQAAMEASTQLLTDAFAEGLITQSSWEEAMLQATLGTLQLSEAQTLAIETALDHKRSMEEAAMAAQALGLKHADLAQTLMDASPTQIAQAAIQELSASYDSGKLSYDNYITALVATQEQFNLVNDKSQAIATGIIGITAALEQGAIAAPDYAKALEDISKGADLETVLEKYQQLPTEVQAVADELDQIDLSGITGAMDSAATDIAANLGGSIETISGSLDELDGRTVSISVAASGFAAATSQANRLTAALEAIPTSISVTVSISTVGSIPTGLGSLPGGSAFTGSGGVGPVPGGSLVPATPAGSSAFMVSAPSTSFSTAPVSQDTYNIYNPLAAAIIAEQKHAERLATAQEVLR